MACLWFKNLKSMTTPIADENKMEKIRLTVFDVDGTLIKVDSIWRFLHEKLSTSTKSKQHLEYFYQGKITYDEWAQLDASLWKNQQLSKIKKMVNEIPYFNGAKDVIKTLQSHDIKIALLSAGLSIVGERIERDFKVDYSMSNELVATNDLLTGKVRVNVSLDNKTKALNHILHKSKIKSEECCAVGDDESLIPLFKEVALGIAFNPCNEEVEKNADIIVKSEDLRDILPYILRGKI